ncbi:hypothetical protein ACS0TY_014711 [Phlomoides rotata]
MSVTSQAAYEDCLDLLDHSVDLLTNSLTSAASGGELSSSIQDVSTCLSAALTNQDTCTEGFDELNGDVKHQMSERVKDLSEHGDDFSDIPIQNRRKGRGRGRGRGRGEENKPKKRGESQNWWFMYRPDKLTRFIYGSKYIVCTWYI